MDEQVLPLPQDTPLDQIKLMGSFTTYDNYTTGNWKTTFRFESPNTQKQATVDLKLEEVRIQSLSLSPLGLTIEGILLNGNDRPDLDIALVYHDGTTKELGYGLSYVENNRIQMKSSFNVPQDMEKVAHVVINGNTIALQ